MQKIFDKKTIETAIINCKYSELLNALSIPLFIIRYKAGEIISSPLDTTSYFQIVISGNLSIYYIRDDGSSYSLSSGSDGYIIGDLDLFTTHDSNVFAEATNDVVTIACDSITYKDDLLNNTVFTCFVATAIAKKLKSVMNLDATFPTLNERVLNYMTFKCENHTLQGLEKTAFKLHCSPRQLQRILNKYTQEGIIEKIGKGTYHLK